MKITVTAHPNSRRPRIEGDLLSGLDIYVWESPEEGKANKAVLDALVKHLKIKKSQIFLVQGEKSKIKVFELMSHSA